MEAKLIYNGVDLARLAAENGVVQDTVFRSSRSIVTLDGSLRKREVPKRKISVSLVELRDSTLSSLASAMIPQGSLEYTDRDRGDRTAIFYAHIVSATEKTVRGGNTYWSGIKIELEEV